MYFAYERDVNSYSQRADWQIVSSEEGYHNIIPSHTFFSQHDDANTFFQSRGGSMILQVWVGLNKEVMIHDF